LASETEIDRRRDLVFKISDDMEKNSHLKDLQALGPLEVFRADLQEEGSFDDAVAGCDYAFLVAAPVNLNAENPEVKKSHYSHQTLVLTPLPDCCGCQLFVPSWHAFFRLLLTLNSKATEYRLLLFTFAHCDSNMFSNGRKT
jgi:hypothetical protein